MTEAPFGAAGEAPAFLQLGELSSAEDEALRRLDRQLRIARKANVRQEAFYEGSRVVRDLGISIPPHLKDLEAVAAGPEIVVDVIDERMDWRGWSSDEDLGLDDVYQDNHLGIEVAQATLDSLICGVGFLSAGTGEGDDEPGILAKAESPNHVTATWDPRTRRPSEGLRWTFDESGRRSGWKLYLPGVTVDVESDGSGRFRVTERDEHRRDRIPLSMLLNRPRSSRMTGRSEITRAVRSLTDSTMRTLLGMEIAREFYAVIQRYLLGADESMFEDADGNRKQMWDVMMGRLLVAPRDEDGELPVVGQFQASSPQPFTELIKTYYQLLSAATGIPTTHFGFATDNPASADAIQRADMRLDKRAERRQKHYDLGLVDFAETCFLWRTGELPPPRSIHSLWVDPGAPTPAAQADRAGKMIAAGVLDPSWDFTLEQYGLSDDEIRRVRAERRKSGGFSSVLEALRQPGQPAPTEVTDGAAGA